MKSIRQILVILLVGVLLIGCTLLEPKSTGVTEPKPIPAKNQTQEKPLSLPKRTVPTVKMTTNNKVLAEIHKVRSKLVINRGATMQKQVAFTFDDGPDTHFTKQILEILKKEQVPATFFVTGNNVKAHPEMLQRIAEEGHSIGNHSWNHPQLNKMKAASVNQQISTTNDAIQKVTGKKPTLFRPPYGAFNQMVLGEVKKHNMKVILWSVDTRDWDNPTKDEIMEVFHKQVSPGGIVLQHNAGNAGLKETVNALPNMIHELKRQGYRFVTVDQLLEVPAYQ